MAHLERPLSSVLLVVGVLLVLGGLSRAVGFTPTGIVASAAAVAALLYAGATWFGSAASSRSPDSPIPVLVFDRHGRIVAGAAAGEPLAQQFPERWRPEIEQRCAAALAGTSARFPCLHRGRTVVFDALPVRGPDGAVVCGVLLRAETEPDAVPAGV